ncbi:hypothetical protein H6F46_18155 [Limnothrix sp. FACHB-1083]|uniref:hypothetical protein n=1 Tax=unclassified Limnothrix TaxID=2632864 RepID=UPI001680886B|nr:MULTISPECIES: hypothetical protein [unclassified Limnothrix]MBD2162615.1 hypothetical protein [Limnothrix sp. FACHB-1083]MBD2193720.1 hypothetical protein [Limnothrix sp. FACHB-1088]
MNSVIWVGDRFLNLDWIRQIHAEAKTGELTIVWADGDTLNLSGTMAVGLFNALKERCEGKNLAVEVMQDLHTALPDWFQELWGVGQYPEPVELENNILDELEF